MGIGLWVIEFNRVGVIRDGVTEEAESEPNLEHLRLR
jgi:hypothetical protein